MGPFSDFQYGFMSFPSIADLLTVVSDRIASAGLLTGLGLLELYHLLHPRLVIGFGMLVFFKSCAISGQIFGLISSFLSNRQL